MTRVQEKLLCDEAVARRDAEIQELYEIADGAHGDGPHRRGAARAMLARIANATAPESMRAAPAAKVLA